MNSRGPGSSHIPPLPSLPGWESSSPRPPLSPPRDTPGQCACARGRGAQGQQHPYLLNGTRCILPLPGVAENPGTVTPAMGLSFWVALAQFRTTGCLLPRKLSASGAGGHGRPSRLGHPSCCLGPDRAMEVILGTSHTQIEGPLRVPMARVSAGRCSGVAWRKGLDGSWLAAQCFSPNLTKALGGGHTPLGWGGKGSKKQALCLSSWPSGLEQGVCGGWAGAGTGHTQIPNTT